MSSVSILGSIALLYGHAVSGMTYICIKYIYNVVMTCLMCVRDSYEFCLYSRLNCFALWTCCFWYDLYMQGCLKHL